MGMNSVRFSSLTVGLIATLGLVTISASSQSRRPQSFPSVQQVSLANPGVGPWVALRPGSAAVKLSDGRILVSGGQNARGKKVCDMAFYNPGTQTWSPGNPMLFKRRNHAATLLPDGRVLVVGGGTGFSANPEIYDPTTDRWTMAATMASPGAIADGDAPGHVTFRNGTLERLNDGRILAVGTNGNGAQIYDPEKDRWSLADLK